MTALYLIIWFGFIAGEAYRNYYIIEKSKSRPNYLQSFVLRGMAAILQGVLFNPQNMADYLPVFIFQVSSFWLLFDVLLNYMRQKPFLYVGKDSGYIDKFFVWVNSDAFLLTCKVLAFMVMVLAVFVVYQS